MVKEKDLIVGRWYIVKPNYYTYDDTNSFLAAFVGDLFKKIDHETHGLCNHYFYFLTNFGSNLMAFDEEGLKDYIIELDDYKECVEKEFPLNDRDENLYDKYLMKNNEKILR